MNGDKPAFPQPVNLDSGVYVDGMTATCACGRAIRLSGEALELAELWGLVFCPDCGAVYGRSHD